MAEKDKYHLSWDCDFHTSTREYSRRFRGKPGAFMLNRQGEVLAGLLGNLSGKRVLEAGAGHGQNVKTVLSLGADYTAYVSSLDCAGMLKEKLKELSFDPYTVIKYGPLNKIPFPDASFDAVISFRIVSHVPDWRLFLSELCRVSKKHVVIDFAPEAPRLLKKTLSLIKGRFETASRDFSTQSAAEIAQAASRSGFFLKAVEREFILPMVAHRISGGVFFPLEKAAVKMKLTRFAGGPAAALLERSKEY
jgi:ubiquinone/menaquinone biosynthesis C-methylase UbiE